MRGVLAFAAGLAAMSIAFGSPATAEPLTASRVVALAQTRSPQARIAATRVTEARARLSGASVIAIDNPVLEGVRGTGNEADLSEVELTVPLGMGVRRSRRIAEARAGVDREQFLEIDAKVRSVAQALGAYYRVLHAERRWAIATERRERAGELVRIATDRLMAGDAARWETVVAETELSRARSEVFAEERFVAETRMELANALGLPSGSGLEVAGDLEDRTLLDGGVTAAPERRADVIAAEGELRSADAAVSRAGAGFLPDLSFRMKYERTENEEIVSPGLALSLPLFNRGQGERGEARARRERATIELEALRSSALAEVEGARSAYESMTAAAREMVERALPQAVEVEKLARQSYEAGKLDLPALLVVRNEALDTRRECADRLLEAATSGIALAVALGAPAREP